MSDWGWFWVFSAVCGAGVLFGELLVRRLAPESSRRFVHAYTGLAVVLSPLAFEQPTPLYLLVALFAGLNFWATRRRVFRGMHGIARHSYGTAVFPLALGVALLGCWTLDPSRVFALQIAFAVLALADPAASWVGSRWPHARPFLVGGAVKTVAGSVAFATVTFALVAGGLFLLDPWGLTLRATLGVAVLVSLLATPAEMLGARGWDNLTIVMAVIAPLVYLHGAPEAWPALLEAAGWALLFASVAFGLRTLELSGALAAGLLAFCVVGLGGWDWALPGFAFFILSSALSKIGKKSKRLAVQAEKGSRRDAAQVYANGGVAWVLLLVHVFAPAEWLYWGFVGAFAAAAADTWASEIGTWARAPTRSLSTWRPVPPGLSGGVSWPGTLGALAGALTVFAPIPWLGAERLGEFGLHAAILVVSGGVLGSLLDSWLGDTAQALYKNANSELTESACSETGPNRLVRGWAWMDNDRVNIACTLSGAVLAAAGAFMLS